MMNWMLGLTVVAVAACTAFRMLRKRRALSDADATLRQREIERFENEGGGVHAIPI